MLCPFRTTWLSTTCKMSILLLHVPCKAAPSLDYVLKWSARFQSKWGEWKSECNAVPHSSPRRWGMSWMVSTQSWTEEPGNERMKLKHFNAAWHLNLQISTPTQKSAQRKKKKEAQTSGLYLIPPPSNSQKYVPTKYFCGAGVLLSAAKLINADLVFWGFFCLFVFFPSPVQFF